MIARERSRPDGIDGVQLVSLQKGEGYEQLGDLGGHLPIIDLNKEATRGVLLGFDLWLGLGTLATWLVVAAIFRLSSLAALVASVAALAICMRLRSAVRGLARISRRSGRTPIRC